MGKQREERERKERMAAGNVTRADVAGQLARLAWGKSNDCVKLTTGENVDLDKLDLSLLREFHRSGNGGVDLKLIDRMEVLTLLAQLAKEDGADPQALLDALLGP